MSNANIAAALKAGTVTQAKIDDSAKRVLTPLFAVGAFDKANNNTAANNVSTSAHNDLSRELSAKATVLLKNDNNFLPLKKAGAGSGSGSGSGNGKFTVVVIGKEAMGLTVHGGGSGHVDVAHVEAPLVSLHEKLGVKLPPPPGIE